jgi:sugar lactone lactonase YvrE
MCGLPKMCEEPEGSLYRLDPDGSIHTMETGLKVSNGISWSPDNKLMYLTDSPLHMIYVYDFDPASGTIENRRPFIHTPDETGVPDGLTIDSEGCIWSARWGGWGRAFRRTVYYLCLDSFECRTKKATTVRR